MFAGPGLVAVSVTLGLGRALVVGPVVRQWVVRAGRPFTRSGSVGTVSCDRNGSKRRNQS